MTPQMIDVGKQIRYNRIVNPETGRTVIVPLDHGIILGPIAGIEDPAETVRKVVAGEPTRSSSIPVWHAASIAHT